MRKIVQSLLLFLALSLLFTTTVFAKNEHAKQSLVSLGDSVPYGYNLEESNDEPSRLAFPYLIGDNAGLRVRNLSVPGMTTSDLLSALEDPKYQQTVSKADYITLNIGSNDLLQPALKVAQMNSNGNEDLFKKILGEQLLLIKTNVPNLLTSLNVNVSEILSEIRKLNPGAPIVFYNIYNPFNYQDQQLSNIVNGVLPIVNTTLSQNVKGIHNVYVVDAYGTLTEFGDIILGDIHPTVEGQEKLAKIGLEALGF